MEKENIVCSRTSKPPIDPLNCLKANAELFTIGMIQPVGKVRVAPDFVGNSDREGSKQKFWKYLVLAKKRNWDLVLTPEYSCPWEALVEALTNGEMPGKGKLWVLGCEGITPDGLCELRNTYGNIIWRFEKPRQLDFEGKHYLDPVCYVMRSSDDCPVVFVQFKGCTMADANGEHEREHMICGRTRYILKNKVSTVYLTTLICSDTLASDLSIEECAQMREEPFLYLHLQLCEDPRNEAFANFRRSAYSEGRSEWEFICLNWARGTQIPGIAPLKFGGSAYYSPSPDVSTKDARINDNHSMGLYFTYAPKKRTHMYYFNYDEHVYCLKTTKASIGGASGPKKGNKRTGPRMVQTYRWTHGECDWTGDAVPNDGFPERCAAFPEELEPFSDTRIPPLDRERLLEISTGRAGKTASRNWHWHSPRQITSMRIEHNEILKRGVFCQDPDPESEDAWKQQATLLAYLRNTVLPNPNHIPCELGVLCDNPLLVCPKGTNELAYNLQSGKGGTKGTGAYIGNATSEQAQVVFARMQALEGVDPTILAVWYNTGSGIRCEVNGERAIDKTNDNPADIAGGDSA